MGRKMSTPEQISGKLREAVDRRPRDGRGETLHMRVLPESYDTLRFRDEPDNSLERDEG